MKHLPKLWDVRPSFPLVQWSTEASVFSLGCDISENDSQYRLSFDVPGVRKEDLKINVRDNMLVVRGERKEEHEGKGKHSHHSEKFYGAFERSFTLPAGVMAEQIAADYKDGVLWVTVPKPVAAKGHAVKIRDATAHKEPLSGRRSDHIDRAGASYDRFDLIT